MQIIFTIFLFIIGACVGSFLCCQARRLRRREKHHKPLGRHSVCLHCHRRLKWYDNIPIISWLTLKGECRRCHKKIGLAEFLSELGLAIFFAMIGTTINPVLATPQAWASLVAVLIFVSTLGFLAIYDGLYGELPTPCLTISIVCAIIILILKEWTILSIASFTPELIYKPLLSALILGGLYLALYLLSKGKWVGNGDWLLGTAIGIALYEPWLALIALFLANATACLIMYPVVKSKKNHHVHFGPFMVVAFVISYTFAKFFLSVL